MNQTSLYCFRDIFQELHYCALDSQCSIYNLTKFYLELDGNKLLVAPHNGTIMCVGFQNNLPISRPMSFSYIPADAEIMAIDSFNYASGVFVVGIIFVKVSRQRRESSGKSLTSFFNIYSEAGITCETHLYKIDQKCKTLELGFLPYHLYHTEIYNGDQGTSAETVFLISGGDEKMHMFKAGSNDDADDTDGSGSYVEVDVENYFVEFSSLPGVVTRMQVLNLPDINRRLSVVGCKDGRVEVYLSNLFKNELLRSFTFEQDSMTTSVQIFCPFAYTAGNSPDVSAFSVLVTSAFEEAFVAKGAFELGFASLAALEGSDQFDCVLCSLVGDIDFDGEMEILLGCYGQKLLVYKMEKSGRNVSSSYISKLARRKSQTFPEAERRPKLRTSSVVQLPSMLSTRGVFFSSSSSFPTLPSDDVRSDDRGGLTSNSNYQTLESDDANPRLDSVFHAEASQGRSLGNSDYSLLASRDFQDPILGLDLVDLTSDSVDELVVMTMNGVHVLQRSVDYMMDMFKSKLKSLRGAKVEIGEKSKPEKVEGSSNDDDDDDDDDISERSFITKYE